MFSLKLITAKPTICAQHPATAAPPAKPVKPKAAQIAAELIGKVKATPIITETIIPIIKGFKVVAQTTSLPTALAASPIYFAVKTVSKAPTIIVTKGVTIISTLVFLLTRFPTSAATIAITKTAKGPPAPPVTFAPEPTAAKENKTKAGTCIAYPIPIAIAAPTT